MKKEYTVPELELIKLEDIITQSASDSSDIIHAGTCTISGVNT